MAKKINASFEESFTKLTKAADQLKNDATSLEETLQYFEEGTKQYQVCQEILQSAKQKIYLFDEADESLKEME